MQVEQGLIKSYGARKFDLPDGEVGFKAVANKVQLPRVSISFCHYNNPVQIEFPEADYARQQFVLYGSGFSIIRGKSTAINPAVSFVTAPNTEIGLDCEAGFEQLVLTITTDALVNQLSHILGSALKQPLEFFGPVDLQQSSGRRLSRFIRHFVSELDAEPSNIPKPLLAEMEDTLITAFLLSNAHNTGEIVERGPVSIAPWQVKRAEEYITANWNQPITIADLVKHTGVSARSIFNTFKDVRGYSPMEFVKSVRLEHARSLLRSAAPGTSVTGVAFACSFGNLGHFSKDYYRSFGELPSNTLKRAKGGGD